MRNLVKESLYDDPGLTGDDFDGQTFSFPWKNNENNNNFLDRLDDFDIEYDDPGLTDGTTLIIYPNNDEEAAFCQTAASDFDIELD